MLQMGVRSIHSIIFPPNEIVMLARTVGENLTLDGMEWNGMEQNRIRYVVCWEEADGWG